MSVVVPIDCQPGQAPYLFTIEDDGSITVKGEEWEAMQAAAALGFEPTVCYGTYNYFKHRPFFLMLGSKLVPFEPEDLLVIGVAIAKDHPTLLSTSYPGVEEDYEIYHRIANGERIEIDLYVSQKHHHYHWTNTTMDQLDDMIPEDRESILALWELRNLAKNIVRGLERRDFNKETIDKDFMDFLHRLSKAIGHEAARTIPPRLRESDAKSLAFIAKKRLITTAIGMAQDILEERDQEEADE